MAQQLMQAYQQAPWRIQVQRLRTFLLLILVFALVTGMYLYISAQAAMAGLDTQQGEWLRQDLLREVASLKVKLGTLTSVSAMEERAIKLGYKPAPSDKGMYVVVPGYSGRPTVNLAPPAGPDVLPTSALKPEYTESLWEFLFKNVSGLQITPGGKPQ
jgi:hypothetical protein